MTELTSTGENGAMQGSTALWERALSSLPGGNTRTTIFHEPYPVYFVRGEGCRVWDVDGIERIDFISNYTSLILGHAPSAGRGGGAAPGGEG